MLTAFIAIGTYRPFFQTVHANDPVGYYVWARSAMFDGDLQFENEYRKLNPKFGGAPVDQFVDPDAPRTITGHTPNGFAVGSSILWAPFIAAVHPFAKYLGGAPNGFSQPYFMAVFLAVTFYGLAGVVALYYALRTWYSSGASAIASVAAWAASPMLFYTFPDGAMAHSCSMFSMCVFFLAWVRLRERPSVWAWFSIGLALGFGAMVRWQNVTYAIIPTIDMLSRMSRACVVRLAFCAAGTVIAFAPQMAGWWIVFGSPVTMPQGPDFVHWLHPHFYDVLFSNSVGLITWTPLCGVAIFGLGFSRRSLRMPYAALLVALIIQLYLNACIYETGWAFGSRRLDNAIPVFAAGLAALFVRMQRVWHRRLAIGIAGIAIVWNFLFALQYGGILDGLYMQRAYAHYASEYRVSMDSLLETNCLPDGTPIDPNACIFPRAGGATLEQFTYDKLLVIQMIAHHLFGARLPK